MTGPARWVCGFLMLLALTGCTGADDGGESPPSVPPAPSGEPAPPGQTASSAPAERPATSGSQLSADRLEAVLRAVNESEVLNASVIPDAEIRPRLEEDPGQGENVVVSPEECSVYAESSPEQFSAEANIAVMSFAGESSLHPDSIILSSLPARDSALQQLETSRGLLEACSEFTVEISGEKISQTVEELEVETEADAAVALRTTVRVPGSTQESVTITGVVNSTTVNVVVGSSTDPDADVARAEELVDLVVVELRAP